MAVVVPSGATPRTFAAGAFDLATLQGGPKWVLTITPSLISSNAAYSGDQSLLSTNTNGGLYLSSRAVSLFNGSGAGTLVVTSGALTWAAGAAITITVNLAAGTNASSLVVAGAATGNGTFPFTTSGTYFDASTLGVGQFSSFGTFQFSGTIGAVTDGVSGTSATISTSTPAPTMSSAARPGTFASISTSAPAPTMSSAAATPVAVGITASAPAPTMTSATSVTGFASISTSTPPPTMTSAAATPSTSLWGTIGASGIGQRADQTGPDTGSFSTQFFARVPSSTVSVNDRLVFNGRRWHVNAGGALSAGAGPSGATGLQADGTATLVPVAGGTELTMTTQTTGSVILVWVMRENSASDTSPPTDNKGNTYVLQGTRNVYAGFITATSALYACFNAVGGANHIISATYPSKGGVGAEATLLAVEVPTGRATSFIADRAFVEVAAPGGGTVNGPSVTTTGPAMIVVAHLGADNVLTPIGSSHPGTAGSPYLVCVNADGRVSIHVNGYVQGQLYYFFVTGPGTYFAVWSTTAPAHLYAVAVQEVAGSVATISTSAPAPAMSAATTTTSVATISTSAPAPAMSSAARPGTFAAVSTSAPAPTMSSATSVAGFAAISTAAPPPAMSSATSVAGFAAISTAAPPPAMSSAATASATASATIATSAPAPSMTSTAERPGFASISTSAPAPSMASASITATTAAISTSTPAPVMTSAGAGPGSFWATVARRCPAAAALLPAEQSLIEAVLDRQVPAGAPDLARVYLARHLVTMGAMGQRGTVGAVTSETLGPSSTSYGGARLSSTWHLTAWGALYLACVGTPGPEVL